MKPRLWQTLDHGLPILAPVQASHSCARSAAVLSTAVRSTQLAPSSKHTGMALATQRSPFLREQAPTPPLKKHATREVEAVVQLQRRE